MTRNLKEIFRDESGVAAVEYAALLALITVAIVLAVMTLGSAVGTEFSEATTEITSP